jgi:hypothetical protein
LGVASTTVGPGDELADPRRVGGVVEVQHDRALRSVVLPEEQRPLGALDVLVEGPDAPAGRSAGRLDLHHVGAEAGQHEPHVLGRLVGDLDDAEAGQVREGGRGGIPSGHRSFPLCEGRTFLMVGSTFAPLTRGSRTASPRCPA